MSIIRSYDIRIMGSYKNHPKNYPCFGGSVTLKVITGEKLADIYRSALLLLSFVTIPHFVNIHELAWEM